MDFIACTIAARNYLPQVRVLAESFRNTNPGRRMVVLILDDLEDQIDPDSEPFEVVRPESLGIEIGELHRMVVIYDVMELATALKPWLLEALLEGGASQVLYLDPDIQVFSSLDRLGELAAEHGIALTPHTLVPFPRDEQTCGEDSILAAGIYNLGFIGVSRKAGSFLAFWQERLRRDCVVDPKNMRFVDQRWIDFVPGLYDHVIIRDPEYNVAYWNLHGRELTRDGVTYAVNGRPLAFFHFSGYSPDVPHLLSKHQGGRPRILLSEHPEVARICGEYGALLTSHGYGVDNQAAYGFAQMANGVRIDPAVRAVYRDLVEAVDEHEGPIPPDPFDPRGADSLMDLLNEPSEITGWERLTNYLAATWISRDDLQQVYPDPPRDDYEGYFAWARNEVAEGRMDALLATEPRYSEESRNQTTSPEGGGPSWAPAAELRPGVVVAGYFRAEVGVGEAGRLTSRLVQAAGLPYSTVTCTTTPSRQQHEFVDGGEHWRNFDTNVVAVNADRFPEFIRDMGPEFAAGRYTIGQWAWELDAFPRRFWPSFDLVDEVWALSEFNRASIAAATDKPVHVVPLPVLEPPLAPGATRATFGLSDRFMFLFCFDLFSILERKNPLGLVRAFRQAFNPGEGPILVLKVINGDLRASDLERIRWEVKDRPDIVIIDRYLRQEEQASLMSLADCYVSLHRSEGFGLTMAEAMALGKPVIATGYSGNLDFMTQDTAYLVPWELGSVPAGCDPYPIGAHWADPDLGEAAVLMRQVVSDPEEAVARGGRARETILREHGVDQGAAVVLARFEEIQRMRGRMIEKASRRHQAEEIAPPLLRDDGGSSRGITKLASRLVDHALRGRDRAIRDLAASQSALALSVQGRMDLFEDASELGATQISRFGKRLYDQTEHAEAEIAALRQDQQRLRKSLAGDGPHEPSWKVVQQSVAGLRAIPYMSDGGLSISTEDGQDSIGFSAAAGANFSEYAGFEDIFRGSEEMIRQMLRTYVPILSECSSVVDFGCGRGEMLDLMAESGVVAIGVDSDESMIERCLAKGHKALHEDGLTYLSRLEPGSVGAVFSAQVAEHLGYENLLKLLHEARRVLEPGGVFIAETVNPHAVHGFKTFWVDLTHRVPIFPEVLVAHCRGAGYAEARVTFPGGSGDFEVDRWSVGQYAVVARTARQG